jgi:hypothetical protein
MLIRILLVLFLLSPATQTEVRRQRLKGITFAFVAFLFSCQRTGLAERAARVPDPSVRVKRNVSVSEPIPSDPGHVYRSDTSVVKRSGDAYCRNRGSYAPSATLSNAAEVVSVTGRSDGLFQTAPAVPARPSTAAYDRKPLRAFRLPFVFQRSFPRRDQP